MYSVRIADLHEGLVLGKDIVCGNVSIANRGTIISSDLICYLGKNLDKINSVYVLSIKEIGFLIFEDDTLFKGYVNYISLYINKLMYHDLANISKLPIIINLAQGYLLENRLVVYSLIKLSYYHSYTMRHCINVATYSLVLGFNLGLCYKELRDLFIGGILHDLGKLSISTDILDKNCSLSEAEFKIIKLHPLYGLNSSGSISDLSNNIKKIILQHHEKLDGSGYPENLMGYEIFYLSKIVTICDIFDALTSNRSYHNAMSNISALGIIHDDVVNGKLDCNLVSCLSNTVNINGSAFLKKGR